VNVLLDTHVLIWWIENNRRLGKRAKSIIADDRTSVWISAATVWEISVKAAAGRLDLRASFPDELSAEMQQSGFRPLAITFEHAFAVRKLPLLHTDPFDRMLVAQAQCEGLTLVSADTIFPQYHIPILDASE
jgi:PIN domain nuclease of toxin-antitoxin system